MLFCDYVQYSVEARARTLSLSLYTELLGAETRLSSREGAREASRSYNRCSRVSETCTHKPISLAYLGSSNRAHTVVLRGSSRARCERGLGWGVYRGSWAEPAWFSTACDPNRCMLKPTASLCAVHQNGILLASRLALRRADDTVNSWAILSSLAFDGEEGCTAVSHATVVGGKSRNAGHHGLQRHGPSGQARAARWRVARARREVWF